MTIPQHRRGAALLATMACAAAVVVVPSSAVAAAAERPDLVVVGPAVDRTRIVEGAVLTVTHQVRNAGSAKAAGSQTRFYLTRDAAASLAARGASRTNPRSSMSDVLLTATRRTAGLAARKASTRTRTKVTVPVGVRSGTYRVLVCADDTGAVRELRDAAGRRADAGTRRARGGVAG